MDLSKEVFDKMRKGKQMIVAILNAQQKTKRERRPKPTRLVRQVGNQQRKHEDPGHNTDPEQIAMNAILVIILP